MKTEEMVCIMCPLGCRLIVTVQDNGEISVAGNKCPRGIEYAVQEITEPLRVLTTSILVINGEMPLVSVKTTKPVPRKSINEIMSILKTKTVQAPVKSGDVIIPNILGTGADIVATRNVERIETA
ncbi:MAG: DUF1667 domain-containing protein [Fervidobacterium sp.]|jgi:CxxC motif-containing protein